MPDSKAKRVMLKLGDYTFGIETAAYQKLTRLAEYRWARQDIIDNRPGYQFMGPGEETIKLPGVIYPHYRGGLGQVQSMRQVAIEGAPMLLIDSLGHIYGRWVIRRVEERTSDYLAGGVPRKIQFDLEIVYIDDGRQG